jgi:hypothetical protein
MYSGNRRGRFHIGSRAKRLPNNADWPGAHSGQQYRPSAGDIFAARMRYTLRVAPLALGAIYAACAACGQGRPLRVPVAPLAQ